MKFRDDYLRISNRAGEDDSIETFKGLAKRQKADIDELEKAVMERRVPKIDVSGVKK